MDKSDTLNKKRRCSLVAAFKKENTENSIYNIGYSGIYVQRGAEYNFFMFAKATEGNQIVEISLRSKCGKKVYAAKTLEITSDGYNRYDCVLKANDTDTEATFHIFKTEGS